MWFVSLFGRDIKLQNILLDKDGHCKLGDYGISKLGIFHGMKTRSAKGTIPYMAPEVIITIYSTCDSCIFVY